MDTEPKLRQNDVVSLQRLIERVCCDPVLSDSTRFAIMVALVLLRKATLSKLCRVTQLKPSVVLYHLKKLVDKGLVAKFKIVENGQIETVYVLTEKGAQQLVRYVKAMSNLVSEVLKTFREGEQREERVTEEPE